MKERIHLEVHSVDGKIILKKNIIGMGWINVAHNVEKRHGLSNTSLNCRVL